MELSNVAQRIFQVASAEHPIVRRAFERIRDIIRPVGCSQSSSTKLLTEWLDKIMLYNVPHGKLWRLLQVVQSFESMSSGPVSERDLTNAAILGWVVEMFQAHYLILDDIMDKSLTRRNRKCWYRLDEVGLRAINDAILLETASLSVVREVFRFHPSYLGILELLNEVNYQTCQGQCLDMLSENEACHDQERYDCIVELKTSFYTFSLPIRLGMYLAGVWDPEKHKSAEKIALQIGNIFQVQDDFLDCYGDPTKSGKMGTDIIDRKCSWLLVRALLKASPEQKDRILSNIGKGKIGELEEGIVKTVYRELQMENEFRDFESRAFETINSSIEQMEEQHGLDSTIFKVLVRQLYRREK